MLRAVTTVLLLFDIRIGMHIRVKNHGRIRK